MVRADPVIALDDMDPALPEETVPVPDDLKGFFKKMFYQVPAGGIAGVDHDRKLCDLINFPAFLGFDQGHVFIKPQPVTVKAGVEGILVQVEFLLKDREFS